MITIVDNMHRVVRVQFRFPHSKRRRIRRKWAARACNYRSTPDPSLYYVAPDMIIGHPATTWALHAELKALGAPCKVCRDADGAVVVIDGDNNGRRLHA